MSRLTHLDDDGRARMVDVSGKEPTTRIATAQGSLSCDRATLDQVRAGTAPKGSVMRTAELAGIMAAKRTAELIPLCHPLPLSSVQVELACRSEPAAVEITATCRSVGRTGVEMEALCAVSAAALTVYDMCKAVDRAMRITDVRLRHKSGGKSGTYTAD